MKILSTKKKEFDKYLNNLLDKRKKKIQLNPVSVIKIINDLKKMVIKLYLSMKLSLIIIKL